MDLEAGSRSANGWHDLAHILRQPALDLAGGIAGGAHVRIVPGRIELTGAAPTWCGATSPRGPRSTARSRRPRGVTGARSRGADDPAGA
jgi:hypothetical protein